MNAHPFDTGTRQDTGGDVRLAPASRLPRAALVDLFNRGYSGYFVPVHLTEEMLAGMAASWDIDFDGSRVALRDGTPLAFTLLAIRGRRGWISGMGVPPEGRGAGLGRLTMEAVLDEARARGLERVDLEVLEPNLHAIRIYEGCGFTDRRRLDVLKRAAAPPPDEPSVDGWAIGPLDVALCLERHAGMHPDGVPWQRGLPVLERQRERLTALGLTAGGRLAGWIVTSGNREQVAIQDLALVPDAGPAEARALIRAALAASPEATHRMLNLPRGAATGVFAALGFVTEWTQREMTVALGAPAA